MCFPLDVSYPCTPVHISTIEPCAVSVRAFVLFKSGRLCTYKTLGECKGGESRSSTIGQLQFASCANGSTKTKQKKKCVVTTELSRCVLSSWMLFLLPQLWIAKACVVCTSKEYLCVLSLGWALWPPHRWWWGEGGGGPLQEQSVLVSCLVVGAFVYVSEGSSANLCMCVN